MAAAPPTARVVIDGREVFVPAGSGLVEAAEQLDIEVPVFCYEPRIGPAVGACRMCLVEIEGMPKLQTACSTPVRDGMVVSTVSDRSREAQEAVLEFLLINHPLDCPVCDKGGECPLQDQAFRWGPGSSRFIELKRNSDKPIPISPLIALDRERCILCYRCTRFSAEVAEDNQLIARERGANSVIATFEGRPYEGHFSGNVIELCPVGALTSTEYRFKARPWEAPDHPTVCGLCPVGCNTFATVREGKVVRVLARENTAVDEGWLCDRGRFSYPSLYSPARVTRPVSRPHRERPVGNRPVVDISLEGALEWLYQRLAAPVQWKPDPSLPEDELQSAPEGALWVLSGSETLEEVWAIQQLAAVSAGRVVAVDGASATAPAAKVGASLADVAAAQHIIVIGDADLAEIAPIVDLRVRKAVRDGASLTTAGIGGTRLEPNADRHEFAAPGELDACIQAFCDRMVELSAGNTLTEPGVAIYRDGELSQATIDQLAKAVQLQREGSGLLAIPGASNARGLAALGVEPAGIEQISAHAGGIIFVNVDPNQHWDDEQWRPLIPHAAWTVAVSLYTSSLHDVADLALPATAAVEKEGTLVNLEGRLQRLTVGGTPPDGVRSELSWVSGLARRLGARVPAYAAGAYRQLAESVPKRLPAATHGDIPLDGLLGVYGGPLPRPLTPAGLQRPASSLGLFIAPFLYDAADVANTERMEFLHETTYLTIARDDANSLGMSRGDHVLVQLDGWSFEARIAVSRRIAAGYARTFAGLPGVPSPRRGYHDARISLLAEATPAEAVAAGAATDAEQGA